MIRRISALLFASLFALACAEPPAEADSPAETAEADPAETTAEPVGSVTITSPAEGAELSAGSVEVTLAVDGLSIVPAGDTTPTSGHHHLFLDADISPLGQPIPAVEGSIVHMGDASSSFVFENVQPGEHRIIAVVGDWQHVPLEPLVVDTVRFVVR